MTSDAQFYVDLQQEAHDLAIIEERRAMKFPIARRGIATHELVEAYKEHLKTRIGRDAFFWKPDKYTTQFRKAAMVAIELGVSMKDWVRIQFHELQRERCIQYFNIPYPPPSVMGNAGSIDRFVMFVGRNDTLDVVSQSKMEDRAYRASEYKVGLLRKATGIRTDGRDWMDLVASQMNSGDLSVVWLARQEKEWLTTFIVEYSKAIHSAILAGIEKEIDKRIKEQKH
jgi:hypothetical protein